MEMNLIGDFINLMSYLKVFHQAQKEGFMKSLRMKDHTMGNGN